MLNTSQSATPDDPPGRIITLSDVALALLILIITIVVSKNIPCLLEITLLQRLPLEPSGRYAFSTAVSLLALSTAVLLRESGQVRYSNAAQWLAIWL